jgi:hypothetical protein
VDAGLTTRVPAEERWDATEWGVWDRLWRWLLVRQAEPAPSFQMPLEPPPAGDEEPRIGICCSGGGIRSASFNLGALQEIGPARLQAAKYVAAVSGGSYIAAAFAMVGNTRNPPPGDDSDPRLVTQEWPPFYPGSPEEQYLRNRVSYLAPGAAGMVRLVWRVFCALLVNLALFASAAVLIAAALAAYYSWADPDLDAAAGMAKANPSKALELTGVGISSVGVALGVVLIFWRPLNERISRLVESWSLRLALLGVVVLTLGAILPDLLALLRNDVTGTAADHIYRGIGGTLAGVAGILFAALLQIRARLQDPKETIAELRKDASWLQKLAPRARRFVVGFAAVVLGPLLLVSMLVCATYVEVVADGWWQFVIAGVALLVFVTLYGGGDLTSWSLHPFYRRRLCTAFALKRVKRVGSDGQEIEDDHDGHAVERDQRQLVKLSETRIVPDPSGWPDHKWPTLVVCAAANVSDPGATPPGRSVTSFTFSSEAMGGPLIGGIKTKRFEDKLPQRRKRDFNLPAVVAMSGAALSPTMGKHSRPSLRFLMGLANVRLGVWVPNPRRLDEFIPTRRALVQTFPHTTWQKLRVYLDPRPNPTSEQMEVLRGKRYNRRMAPRPRPIYLLKELLGITSVNDKFLYITDGGHYENLGLVELLRRGCTHVYCFDASGGKELHELGDAISLARSELGVEIEFDRSELDELEPGDDGFAKRPCVTGTIRYTRGAQSAGNIVYAPTVMTRNVPLDVHAFKAKDPHFPRHSTVDQLFTDQKFDAYRVLGRHAARAALAAMDHADGVLTASLDGREGNRPRFALASRLVQRLQRRR